jgi:tRNA pseudouridine65 synthase
MTADADPAAPAAAPAPLPILFLDEHLVAVSKPSGLLVHRDEHHPEAPAALQAVRDQLGRFLWPVHRLDRPTSGILLFAFSSATAAALQASLASDECEKDYQALARWPGSDLSLGDAWVCDRPLHDDKDVARAARTEFRLVERFRHCALVGCRILTGRYHQIRRHLNHCGRHAIGDTTHGKGRINALYRERFGLCRLFLHQHRTRLRHPRTGEPLELLDPLPIELATVLERLRRDGNQCPPEPPTPTTTSNPSRQAPTSDPSVLQPPSP